MRTLLGRWIIVAGSLVCVTTLAGCAASRRSGGPRAVAEASSSAPATAPAAAGDSIAQLSLDQITPKPVLGKPRAPSTAPASLDAIELYARSREAYLKKSNYEAIQLIERAIQADPNSYELQYALGRAYLVIGSPDRAITAFERAAELDPNSIDVQADLGRSYQAKNDLPSAIEHFRLAMQTDGYRTDESTAAVVEYRLAIALQQKGYDRAALECFLRLLNRLEHAGSGLRVGQDIGYLLNRPELLHDEIGKLYEKLGDNQQALREYELVARAVPNEFELQARVVALLQKMGRPRESAAGATELVRKFHASPESVAMLRDIYQKNGFSPAALIDALRKIYRENPIDRSILFALSETLASNGQFDQARDLVEKGIESHNGDADIVERLVRLYSERDQVNDAARLIIRTVAAHPDTTTELQPLLMDLMRPARKNSLRMATLQKLDVPAGAIPARQYWVWKLGSMYSAASRKALEDSARGNFDPAVIAQLEEYYKNDAMDDAAQKKAAEDLVASVQARGRADLAENLRGLISLHSSRIDEAAQHFGEAVKLSKPPSPDLQLAYALAVLRQGNQAKFEQLMWKLLSDRPHFDAAYQMMLVYFRQNNSDAQAVTLVNTWIAAQPSSVAAHIQQVMDLVEQRRVEDAVTLARKLFEQYPDQGDVVRTLMDLLLGTRQQQQLTDTLEAERAKHPNNVVVVSVLVDQYQKQNRISEAIRILDAARAACANDAEQLYDVASLYHRSNQPETAETVLAEVLKIDPNNPQAGNDLGYFWADAGKNLDRAESLIRMAVDVEPYNPSYLDSLGWVLYKRSKFDESVKLLQQACDPIEKADPVVLDHLGDALYRSNRGNDARSKWQQSLQGIQQEKAARQQVQQQLRDDLVKLQLQLEAKLRQADSGQPVNVAPIVESQRPGQTQGQTQANKE